jgi:hypothetical protein
MSLMRWEEVDQIELFIFARFHLHEGTEVAVTRGQPVDNPVDKLGRTGG